MRKAISTIFTALALLALFPACSTVSFVEENPTISKNIVKYATLKAISESDDKRATAEAIVEITGGILAVADDEEFTVERAALILAAELAERDLTAEERVIAETLAALVKETFAKYVDGGALDGRYVVTLREVVRWVRDGAMDHIIYGMRPETIATQLPELE